MITTLSTGHVDLADWLFLIAAILFVLAGVLAAIQKPDPTHGALVPFGLALIAVAWLVL
jgi:hypothetical protein